MLVELILSIGIVYGYNYLEKSKERAIIKKFDEIMNGLGLKNKLDKSFKIKKLSEKKYGYRASLEIPSGLSVEHLSTKLNVLEDNLNAIVKLEKDKFSTDMSMRIVNKDISKFMFKPVKSKESNIYIGRDYKGDDYFIDLNINPMILIAGATGYGKSMLLACILTNLIYNSSNEIELYLTQLIKGEISSFDQCSAVKFTAYTEDELIIAIRKVRKKIDERSFLFKAYGIRNINQWNKHFKSKKMKRIMIICEEMSELMELDIWNDLWAIVKAGRSVGVHLIGALQRSTATNLDTNVKSQMTRITFHQNSIIDSQNIINSNNAMQLKKGECIVSAIDGEVKVKVPYIDEDFVVLNKYISTISIPTNQKKYVVRDTNKDDLDPIIKSSKVFDIVPEELNKVENKIKKRKGIISLEEIENVDKQR